MNLDTIMIGDFGFLSLHVSFPELLQIKVISVSKREIKITLKL